MDIERNTISIYADPSADSTADPNEERKSSRFVQYAKKFKAWYKKCFTEDTENLLKYLSVSVLVGVCMLLGRLAILSVFRLVISADIESSDETLGFFIGAGVIDVFVSLGLPFLLYTLHHRAQFFRFVGSVLFVFNLAQCATLGFLGFLYFENLNMVNFTLTLLQAVFLYLVYHKLLQFARNSTLKGFMLPVCLNICFLYLYLLYNLTFSDRFFGRKLPEAPATAVHINMAGAAVREWINSYIRKTASGGRITHFETESANACIYMSFIREHVNLMIFLLINMLAPFMHWSFLYSSILKKDPALPSSKRTKTLVFLAKSSAFCQFLLTVILVSLFLATTRMHYKSMCGTAKNTDLTDVVSLILAQFKVAQ
ncbi:hypothetical protein NECID01_0646 [Nematocida sp. AWRm77]|nr:hypothetical protein NECID01_0646 [Nematocida sp. AWRm77]